MTLRIGINGLSVATGGNVTYFANLLPALARAAEGRAYIQVYTREGGKVSVPESPAMHEVKLTLPGLASMRRMAWEQTALPFLAKRDRLDVLYGAGDSVPLATPCATVCAFRNPNVYAPLDIWPAGQRARLTALRAIARASAKRSRRGIFVSAAARDEILPVLGLDPSRARVVHHGIGGVFVRALDVPRPIARKYILTVSTIYRYKNFVRLVDAYARFVAGPDAPALAIVGADADPPYTEEIRAAIAAAHLEDHVLLPGEVKYPDVAAWYAHAEAFVFPSYRETFGHPLLEAMAAGIPLAAADTAVMREVGGDVPVYFDPYDIDAMGRALRDVLDGARREARVAKGRAHAAQFTWDRTAEKTLEVFAEAAG